MTNEEEKIVLTERISSLLEELLDYVKPTNGCDDPECTADHDCPDGPWMIDGWAMAVDLIAESKDSTDEVETWTMVYRSKGLPRTQCVGLGITITKYAGG